MTALMYAARKGYAQVVAFLVAHGSHINAQDENGYTVSDLFCVLYLMIKNLRSEYPLACFKIKLFEKCSSEFSALTPL